MRRARLKGEGTHFVHAISRVVDRRFIFEDREKEYFMRLMIRLSNFSGIRVVSWCILSNHFHILLEQPDPEEMEPLNGEELLRRLPYLYSVNQVEEIRRQYLMVVKQGPEFESRFLNRYQQRMGDVSVFMKELKQRFSQWYNRCNDRRGTLWEERFKSVLVEGSEEALMTVAAYIDLNSVRAGIVERPEDYRWCSYARAVAGDKDSRMGLGIILDYCNHQVREFENRWEETLPIYRLWLFSEGRQVSADSAMGTRARKGFSDETVAKVEREGGRMSRAEQLRCRVRYFTEGVVLGSAEFVEKVFENNRAQFGIRRQSGARMMRGGYWGDLRVIRDLRGEVSLN